MVRVKICGITNWADAKAAMDAGADALGFNFYAKSPRRISVSRARAIVRRMPEHVSAVGVFVNAPEAEVRRTAEAAELSVVQLHGEESPRMVERLAQRMPVIKAFRVRHDFRLEDLQKYAGASAFLLDGFDARKRGGTGRIFNWSIAKRAKRLGLVILAGGVTRENATAAIRKARPFAIDVCSGVEARPGKKDAKKLRGLMNAVKREHGERR